MKKDKNFGIADRLNFATWNVRGLNTKESELLSYLKERSINIAVITETKKKLKGTKDIDDFVMLYSGVPQNRRAACGVAILIDGKWRKKIISYTFINERMIMVRLKIERGYLSVIGVYAPENGRKEETETFYEELQSRMNCCNKNDYLIIGGDLNARVGNQPIPSTVGTFGEAVLNENGKQLRDFASFNNLKITNTFFRKKEINKYTWSARGSRSLIDYIIVNGKLSPQVMDTQVFRGYDIHSDHFLVTSRINLLSKWIKPNPKKSFDEVFKVSLLQEDSVRDLYQNRLNQLLQIEDIKDTINEEWNTIKYMITKAAHEALGKQRKCFRKKGLIIWNDDIEKAIKEKQIAFTNYLQRNSDETRRLYKEKRNLAKNIVRKAHQESWNTLISRVENDVHGRQSMAYKLIKRLNREEKDNANIDVIKDREWVEHYKTLWFNPDVPIEIDIGQISESIDELELSELQTVLKSAKNRKAVGTDGLNAELFKYGGNLLQERLLNLFNMCWKTCDIPTEWKTAKIVSIFKKGDRSCCGNYRGISILNSAYKLYSKIINNRLTPLLDSLLLEEQSGFRRGRSCIDDVFTVKQIIEKRREFNLETHLIFIDFEKAFDRVDRKLLWHIMVRRGIPLHLIQVCQSLYQNTTIMINKEIVQTNQGVRQGCGLSPTLFNIYIDDIIRSWKSMADIGIPLNMSTYINTLLFADDQIIIQPNEDDLQKSVHLLHNICSEYNMKISIPKTKCMAFRGKEPIRTKIVIDNKPIEQIQHFNYLGCDITYDYDQDIQNKLHKFQYLCGTLLRTLKRKTRPETQLKFYRVMAVPSLLYGSETWTLSSQDLSRIQAAEMRFLRPVRGCTILDKIRNEDIRRELGIFSIRDKIEEYRQDWKNHVQRMPRGRLPRAAFYYRPQGKRDRGRPRKRWYDQEAGTGLRPIP